MIRPAMNTAASVSSARVWLSGPDSDCQSRFPLLLARPRSCVRMLPE